MRILQSNISIFGNMIIRQGKQLIVRREELRSFCAVSFLHGSSLLGILKSLSLAWLSPRVGVTRCFATATQPQRRHVMCHRTAVRVTGRRAMGA